MAISAIGGLFAGNTYNGYRAAKAQEDAARRAAKQAEAARIQADREFNRLNQKQPNVAALQDRNRAAGKGGIGGTFLTGAQGAPVSQGMLGRTTILGS